MKVADRKSAALLEFNPDLNILSKNKKLQDGLSVVVQVGNTLWVTNDETISLERLTLQNRQTDGTYQYGDHKQFNLSCCLQLPASGSENIEADIEGLDYKDGYLWLIGSHSHVRTKPLKECSVEENIGRLATVSSEGNRFLLARIPLAEGGLVEKVEQDGEKRTAARLHGDDKGNELTEALANDEHLGAFLSIPAKDNGLDIEGLAVAGERTFIGLRGPVLRGFAVILELKLVEEGDSTLKLKKIDSGDDQPYRKHFLQLGGLGVRDLCVQGPDLLILAGPTMNLDGPVIVFRWPGGARPSEESFIRQKDLSVVVQIPYGVDEDHAEGMTIFSPNGADLPSILVVYDSASKRRQKGESALEADIFALP